MWPLIISRESRSSYIITVPDVITRLKVRICFETFYLWKRIKISASPWRLKFKTWIAFLTVIGSHVQKIMRLSEWPSQKKPSLSEGEPNDRFVNAVFFTRASVVIALWWWSRRRVEMTSCAKSWRRSFELGRLSPCKIVFTLEALVATGIGTSQPQVSRSSLRLLKRHVFSFWVKKNFRSHWS